MALYPSPDLYPGPDLFPGQDPGSSEGMSLKQVDPRTIRATWRLAPGDGRHGGAYVVQVQLGSKVFQEYKLPATQRSLVIKNLYPSLTYSITINNTLSESITLEDVANTTVLSADGWAAAAPAGHLAALTRILVNREGSTSTVLHNDVRTVSGTSYNPEASRLTRTFTNLVRGHDYTITFQLRRTRMGAKQLRYQGQVQARLTKRAYSNTQPFLASSTVLDLSATDSTAQAVSGVLRFTAGSTTVEFSLVGVGNPTGVAAGDIVEAVELGRFELRHLLPAAVVNDVVGPLSIAQAYDLTMNSVDGYWFVDKENKERFELMASKSSAPVLYFSDTGGDGKLFYDDQGPVPTFNTQQLVNNLSVTNRRMGTKALSTDDWAADDVSKVFKQDASITRWRARNASVEWCLWDDGFTLARRVASLFARFGGDPKKQLGSIEVNGQQSPRAMFNLEVMDTIYVEFDGWVQESRVKTLAHNVSAADNRWMVQIQLLPIALFRASETFAEFDAFEPATTFAEFNARYGDMTFKQFNKTWRKP